MDFMDFAPNIDIGFCVVYTGLSYFSFSKIINAFLNIFKSEFRNIEIGNCLRYGLEIVLLGMGTEIINIKVYHNNIHSRNLPSPLILTICSQ